MLSALACSAEYALLPALAAASGFRRAAGVMAGAAGAFAPIFFWIETNGAWESPCIAAMLVAMLLLSARLWSGARISPWVYGAAWGLVFLFAPGFLLVFAAILALRWWRSRKAGSVIKASLIAFLVVLPWIVRNYLQFGSVFWIRDNFGLELHISNNPMAQFHKGLVSFRDHPYDHPEAARRLKSIGEVACYREKGELARQWISGNPGRFAQLTAARIWYFWFPRVKHLSSTLLSAVVSIGGFLGLALAIRSKRNLAALLFGLVYLIYPLPYYLVQVDPRYRYPIYPEMLLLAAFFGVSCLQRLTLDRPARWPPTSPRD
jgi:4-amino-4-deoxy-L-arabinose transferase-like glycosyltransferase